MHEHALGAHEAGIEPHHRDFRLARSAAHGQDQAVDALVSEIVQDLPAIAEGSG